MEKSIKAVLFLSATVLIVYIYLWIAFAFLIVVELSFCVITEGLSIGFCRWPIAKCFQYGTTFWPIGLGALLLTQILILTCDLKGWDRDPVKS